MQPMLEFNPAENLMEKEQLDGGWTIVAKVPSQPGSTGGNFSVGYEVEHESGKRAFLKALDFSIALKQPDSTTVLQSLTSAYNYERMVLNECKKRSLDRVVVSIGDGEVPAGDLHTSLPVPYLIFELAEGDIRSRLAETSYYDVAFVLRALHQCAVGIRQLHSLNVAHQDLKPSNVLVFDESECRVSDLGRSSVQGSASPVDINPVAGDLAYAPPELLYREISSDWRVRRFACDLYHLGSLAVFFFSNVGITALWHKHLNESLWPINFGQTYRDVLPHVRDAHDRAFAEFEDSVPDQHRLRLGPAIRQLCEPDPLLRGHPRSRAQNGNTYSLERYVSSFNLLAKTAEWQLRTL